MKLTISLYFVISMTISVLFWSLSFAQEKVYTAHLEYIPGTEEINISSGFGRVIKYVPFEELLKVPQFEGKELYTSIQLGNDVDSVFSIAIDIGDKTEKIYIDFNNDNDLTNDEYIEFKRFDEETGTNISRNTAPVHITYYLKDNGVRTKQEIDLEMTRTSHDSSRLRRMNPSIVERQAELQMELLEGLMWKICSCRMGTIKLKDNEYKIALIESFGDGMFGEYDKFLIDLNQDNQLDLYYDYAEQVSTKIFIADDVIYRIRNVSLAGAYIEIEEAPYTPPDSLPFAVGITVQPFEKEDIYGNQISLSDFIGKTVLMRFTSTGL